MLHEKIQSTIALIEDVVDNRQKENDNANAAKRNSTFFDSLTKLTPSLTSYVLARKNLISPCNQILQISSSIYTVGQHGSSYLKGLKCALSLLGVCDDFVAAPFHRFNVPEREKIRKALEALPFCPELKP